MTNTTTNDGSVHDTKDVLAHIAFLRERALRVERDHLRSVLDEIETKWLVGYVPQGLRDLLASTHARQLRTEPAEDDFGDASIRRGMDAARDRGEDIENMPNPSRLRGSNQ